MICREGISPEGIEMLRLCERVAAKLNARFPAEQVPIKTAVGRLLHAIAEGEMSTDDIREALAYLEERH